MQKNGLEFEFKKIDVDLDKIASEERTKETEIKTAVINFYVLISHEGGEFELKGNTEYTQDGAESEFYDGVEYKSTLTLVSGDILDLEFNGAIKDFFAEDMDFDSLIYDNLSEEEEEELQKIIN